MIAFVVDASLTKHWPLQIVSHNGNVHSVVLGPGEMLLYESASLLHARLVPLHSGTYANLFLHYKPKTWRFTQTAHYDYSLDLAYDGWAYRRPQQADAAAKAALTKILGET